MFGLAKSTEVNTQLAKKSIFEKFEASPSARRLFNEQINRLVIVAEISPHTINLAATEDITAIYIVQVLMKTPECDPKNIMLLSKLIDQNMLFALQYKDTIQFAAYRADNVLMSEKRASNNWLLNLKGLNLESVWDNLIADISGIELKEEQDLDEIIARNERKDKLTKKINSLEKKARREKQARRKWELVQEIKMLEEELRGV